ncbi:MAG: hypothetical protein AUH05_18755 [Ktedonobacter sp. 13_2_20CM_53_11]|nr:MAG: hypothetical protein AUH05_18755 [Ktedonobacter sp. 13_2_20CM_53_11]
MGEAHRQRTCIGTDIPRSQDWEHPIVLWPDICDNFCQILVTIDQLSMKIYKTHAVIFRKYLALAQAQTSLTLIPIPNISGHLFHTSSG